MFILQFILSRTHARTHGITCQNKNRNDVRGDEKENSSTV